MKQVTPLATTAVRQPMNAAMAGRLAAAKAPPMGIPVCRTPIAIPRLSTGNQDMTALLPAGVGNEAPMPAAKSARRAVRKPCVAATVKQNSPTSTLPQTSAARSPCTSTTQPAANMETSEPAMIAELNKPT